MELVCYLRFSMRASVPRAMRAVDEGSGMTVRVMASMPISPAVACRVNCVLAVISRGEEKS